MAIPRVFISSTFYDLKHVRDDIERFVKELGYEPVRNETGAIPYGKEERPEQYAYREVELCDILVAIIGGRYGTESSQDNPYSISQQEIKTAVERGVQVFIFIEQSVFAEYSTYRLNKNNPNVNYSFVDNIRVYQFIEEVFTLPKNNPISQFGSSKDIIDYLQLQWAGLFQRFLKEQQRIAEIKVLEEMKTVASTLRQLVDYLTKENMNKDQAIQSILMVNHPAFRTFAQATKTPYRIIFANWDEFNQWISTRGLKYEETTNGHIIFVSKQNPDRGIRFPEFIFDENNNLKSYSLDDWDENWVTVFDNEIPF